jgi:hypothetical protein
MTSMPAQFEMTSNGPPVLVEPDHDLTRPGTPAAGTPESSMDAASNVASPRLLRHEELPPGPTAPLGAGWQRFVCVKTNIVWYYHPSGYCSRGAHHPIIVYEEDEAREDPPSTEVQLEGHDVTISTLLQRVAALDNETRRLRSEIESGWRRESAILLRLSRLEFASGSGNTFSVSRSTR